MTYTLEVNDPTELTETFNASDEDIDGKGVSGSGGSFTADRDNVTLATDKAYKKTSDSHIKFYNGCSITVTAKEGYAITGIEMTAVSNTYARTWNDQDGKELTINDTKVTWTGVQPSIVIKNTHGS